MPDYLVTDSQTGRKFKLTGDSPPTDAELTGIFGAQTESAAAPSPRATRRAELQTQQAAAREEAAQIGTLRASDIPGAVIESLADASAAMVQAVPNMGAGALRSATPNSRDRLPNTFRRFNAAREQSLAMPFNPDVDTVGRLMEGQQLAAQQRRARIAAPLETATGFLQGEAEGIGEMRQDIRRAGLVSPGAEATFTVDALRGVGSTVPGVVTALATRGQSLAPYVTTALQLYQEAFDTAAASGQGFDTAHAAGLMNVPGAALERFGDVNLAKGLQASLTAAAQQVKQRVPPALLARKMAMDVSGAMVGEGFTEATQTAWQDTVANDLLGFAQDTPAARVQNALAAGGLGAVAGGLVRAPGSAVEAWANRRPSPPAPPAGYVINEQTGTTEFPALENDWLPKPGVESQELRVESPALRPEAAMETRPSAEMGLDRTQPSTLNPELSTDLADTIAALRAGYRPEVEKLPEPVAAPFPPYAEKLGIKSWQQAKKLGLDTIITDAPEMAREVVRAASNWIYASPERAAEYIAGEIVARTRLLGGRETALRSLANDYYQKAKGATEPGQQQRFNATAQALEALQAKPVESFPAPSAAPASQPSTPPLSTSPALRGEAAMETRPSAEMGLDRTQPRTLNPELSTDLADTIAALRAGYRPEVETKLEPSNAQRPTSNAGSDTGPRTVAMLKRSDFKTEEDWVRAVEATEQWANDPGQFSDKRSPSLYEPWTGVLQVVPVANGGYAVEYAGQRVGYGKTEAAAIKAAEKTHLEFHESPLLLSPAPESAATTAPRTGSPSREEIGTRPGELTSKAALRAGYRPEVEQVAVKGNFAIVDDSGEIRADGLSPTEAQERLDNLKAAGWSTARIIDPSTEQATFGQNRLPLGVSVSQWEEMAKLPAREQVVQFGTSRPLLIQEAVMRATSTRTVPAKLSKAEAAAAKAVGLQIVESPSKSKPVVDVESTTPKPTAAAQPGVATPTEATRLNPPQVGQPMVIEPSASVTLKDGTKLKGQGWALPGLETLKVVLVPPRGSKAKATAIGWSVWVSGKMVYSNLKGGEMDTQQQAIAVALPRLRNLLAAAKPPTPAAAKPAPDRIETLLDAAESKLKDTPGAMLEGVTGAPVWLTKAALRGVVQVVRVAYRASKDLALALRAGLEWLRDQNLKGFDEAQAHGWLAKTITEGSNADGLNIRATSDLLAASPLIPDEVRELIANVTYEVVTDKNAVDFANRILDALGDPSAALPILADASNGLGGKRRTVLAFLTLLRLSQAITQAKAAGNTATVARLAETEAAVYDYTLADRITDAAQTLQAVSVFSKMSPEGRLIHARRRIQRAGDRDLDPIKAQLNDALKKLEKAKKDLAEETARGREIQEQAAKAIADALEAEAQRARTALQNAIHLNASNSLEMLPSVWQKAQAAVLQQWHTLGADELVKNLTGRAGQGLENSLWSAVQQKGGAQSTVASVIAQVNRALHEQVNRALNVTPEQFINPATYAMRLRHALGNAEVMSRIWEQTRAAVGANLRAIGEMEGLLLRIGEEIALLEAQAKLPLKGGPEVTATDAKLRKSQQGARDAMLAGRNAGIAQTIVQKRERLADVEAQLAEYRKMEPAWRAVLAMTVDVWGPNLIRGVMAEQMKADGFRLRKAVSDHFRGLAGAPDPMQSLGTLTAKIVAASGLDEQAAGRLAASIEAEFVAQVEKERAKVAERIKAAAVRKAARAADAPRREAESLIDSLQELQTEWLRPPGKRSAIQALVRQAIRSEPGAQFQDETAFRNAVQAGLVALGVPEQSAARLAYETWQAKQARDAGREGDRLDQLIRERMDALKLNLGKLVREHWSKVERAGESLAEQLAGEGGLTPEGAQKLAAAFERRFNQLAQAKLKRELEQVLKPVTRSAIAKPGLVEKLMGLLRLGAFSNEAYWKAVMERLKLPEFSEALRDRLTAIGARLDALPEADIEGRHRVSVEFLNALEQAAGIDPLDLSLGFYVTNLLTGIPTHVANTSANFFAAIANAGIQMELAIAEGRYDDIPAAIEAAAVGLKKALPQAGQVMRTGILPAVRQGQARALRPMELAQFGTRGGVPLRDTGYLSRGAKWALESYPAKILNLWKLNGRAMAAEDLLAFTPAMEVQRVLLARRVARAEGLRGEALRNRVAGLLTDADPAQVEDAREFALRVVNSATPYGLVGAVVNLINQAKGSEHRALRGAANIVAPVLTIPMNAFNESLNYTPVGLWRRRSSVTNLLGRDVKNLSLEQQQDLRAELLAKALTGTLFLTATALMFAQFLDDDDPALALYGTGPQDMTDNKGWRERGALPHSLKVGNTYFSFALTPIAAPLSALGNWFDRERDARIYGKKRSDSLGTQAGVAILSSLDVLFEQPFMVGFVDLFRLAGNTQGSDETKVRSGFRRAAKTASSFVVPNEVRNIDRYFDPKVYPVRDLEGALISSVPFVRGMGGKPALNALGQPIESQPFHRFLSQQASDPLIRGLDAKGAWPTVLDDRNKVWPAKRRAMTEGEFYSYQAETGKALDRKLRAEWPAWSRLPDAIARDKVNEAATKERAIWRARNGWGRP